MVLVKLPVPGRSIIWITVGQGPTALAVGAGGGCLDIFYYSYLSFLSSFSLSLGDGPIQTETLSQRAVKPKTTNQPILYKYQFQPMGFKMPGNDDSCYACLGEQYYYRVYWLHNLDLCKDYESTIFPPLFSEIPT